MADPVHAHRWCSVEAAEHLELAAGPGLDATKPVRDAVLDRGVVTDVEMEERNVAHRSPVAAVEDVALADVERARDHLAALTRDDEAEPVAPALADQPEERQVEVLLAPRQLVDRR